LTHCDAGTGCLEGEPQSETSFPPLHPAADCRSLVAEFARRGRPDLARRLDTCLKGRRPDLRDPSDPRRTFPACGLLCCRWCLRQHKYRWRNSGLLRRAFANAANEDCSLVTIHAASRTLEGLVAENQRFRRAFRDLRARWSRRCPEAARVALAAVLEVSADPASRFAGHWHCVVRHSGIPRADLLARLRGQWRGEARDYGRWVDAKPLWGHRSLEENLDGVLFDYALKPRMASGAPRFPDVRIEAAYWLGLIGSGGLKRMVTVVSGANLPT
jgi:hypothetical protein